MCSIRRFVLIFLRIISKLFQTRLKKKENVRLSFTHHTQAMINHTTRILFIDNL